MPFIEMGGTIEERLGACRGQLINLFAEVSFVSYRLAMRYKR